MKTKKAFPFAFIQNNNIPPIGKALISFVYFCLYSNSYTWGQRWALLTWPCIAVTCTERPVQTAAWRATPTAPGTASPAHATLRRRRGEDHTRDRVCACVCTVYVCMCASVRMH